MSSDHTALDKIEAHLETIGRHLEPKPTYPFYHPMSIARDLFGGFLGIIGGVGIFSLIEPSSDRISRLEKAVNRQASFLGLASGAVAAITFLARKRIFPVLQHPRATQTIGKDFTVKRDIQIERRLPVQPPRTTPAFPAQGLRL